METVILNLVVAVVQAVPSLIAAVQASTTMSEAEKKVALDKLQGELDSAVARVAAVKFRQPE